MQHIVDPPALVEPQTFGRKRISDMLRIHTHTINFSNTDNRWVKSQSQSSTQTLMSPTERAGLSDAVTSAADPVHVPTTKGPFCA